MKKEKELKMLESCLFYYTLPSFIIWIYELINRKCINEGVCYFFEKFWKKEADKMLAINNLPLPKSLILAYIGSKYYIKSQLYCGYWVDQYIYETNKKRLNVKIQLLKSAINSLKQQIKKEKL